MIDTLVVHSLEEVDMAASNPRINITVSREIAYILSETAKMNNQSVSAAALGLIEWAIEEKEDMYFSNAGDEILRSNPKFIPNSDDIWKDIYN